MLHTVHNKWRIYMFPGVLLYDQISINLFQNCMLAPSNFWNYNFSSVFQKVRHIFDHIICSFLFLFFLANFDAPSMKSLINKIISKCMKYLCSSYSRNTINKPQSKNLLYNLHFLRNVL